MSPALAGVLSGVADPRDEAIRRRWEMASRDGGPSRYEVGGCLRKRTCGSRGEARSLARKLRDLGRPGLRAYRCAHCGLFHLTSMARGGVPG